MIRSKFKPFFLIFSLGFYSSLIPAASFNTPQWNNSLIPEFIDKPVHQKILPPLQLIEERKSLFTSEIKVKKVKIRGNTVLAKQLLLPLIQPILNSNVSHSELITLSYKLTLLYRKLGFATSFVVLPDQDFIDGQVILIAIEGSLGHVEIMGNKHLPASYFINALKYQNLKPLNSNKLEQTLETIRIDANLQRIQARIKKSDNIGINDLQVNVKEGGLKQWRLGLNNYRSPISGSNRAFISYRQFNAFNIPNNLSIQLGLTEGIKDVTAKFYKPVSRFKMGFSAYIVRSDSRVIEEKFRSLGLISTTNIFGLAALVKFRQRNKKSISFNVGFEQLDNQNNILGNSQETVFIVMADSQFNYYQLKNHWSSGIRTGIKASGSANSPDVNDNDFYLLNLASQSILSLSNTVNLFQFKSSLQLANGPLSGLERKAIGGVNTARGYRESTLVRDNGVTLQSEFIHRFNKGFVGQLFIDVGRGWNSSENNQSKTLISIGTGINWQPVKNMDTQFSWGIPLLNRLSGKTLQDYGFQFNVQYLY